VQRHRVPAPPRHQVRRVLGRGRPRLRVGHCLRGDAPTVGGGGRARRPQQGVLRGGRREVGWRLAWGGGGVSEVSNPARIDRAVRLGRETEPKVASAPPPRVLPPPTPPAPRTLVPAHAANRGHFTPARGGGREGGGGRGGRSTRLIAGRPPTVTKHECARPASPQTAAPRCRGPPWTEATCSGGEGHGCVGEEAWGRGTQKSRGCGANTLETPTKRKKKSHQTLCGASARQPCRRRGGAAPPQVCAENGGGRALWPQRALTGLARPREKNHPSGPPPPPRLPSRERERESK
jgi:hypothetical protein